jgi:hypothetical protein
MKDYHFKVETKEAGQRRRYGDSYYHYVVEVVSQPDYSEEQAVRQFCTGFLEPARYSEDKIKELMKKEHDFGLNFAPYYTEFKKTGDNTYSYKVTRPSTH